MNANDRLRAIAAPRGGWGALLALLLVGCGGALPAASTPARRGQVPAGTPPEVDIALARARGAERGFEWSPYERASFERAAAEGKLVLIDGAAEWCHWCHVMDATTYRDPAVGRTLARDFVTIRVDVDARPDLAERYGAWGWPATIVLTPDGRELGKLRGFVPAKELLAALDAARVAGGKAGPPARPWAVRAATPEELPWIAAHAARELDAYWDDDRGGWGRRQKAPLGLDLELEAVRAGRGDAVAAARVARAATAQRALIDPVWGGLYQYSDGGGWDSPHFEKLTVLQAENLAAYATAFRATRDPALRADAESVARYLLEHLQGESGAFGASQDADVAAHDEQREFVDGHVFYALDDAGRRAVGEPRVDRSVYPFENGLVIAALAALAEATGEARWRDAARRAADAMLRTAVGPDGAVHRAPEGQRRVAFLADAASLGLGLAVLARVSGEGRYAEASAAIAATAWRSFDDGGGALLASTPDPDAVGVLAERRRPFEPNVLFARQLAALADLRADPALRARGRVLLAAVATPEAIAEQGRMLGGFLLAADALGVGAPPEAALPPTPGVD